MTKGTIFRLLARPQLRFLAFFIYILVSSNKLLANEEFAKDLPPIIHLLMDDSFDSGEVIKHNYIKNTGPDKNPMKGWSDGWNRTQQSRDETSVGFQYIKWRQIEPQKDVYDMAAVERILDDHGTVGRHIIIRLQCDWAGSYNPGPNQAHQGRSDGCPEWIYEDETSGGLGVAHITGEPGTNSQGQPTAPRNVTDYNDPNYIAQAEKLIAMLAEFYADDERLYAVELGILGYWGEWHTFGSNLNPNPPSGSDYTAEDVEMYSNSYIIRDSTKQAILDAYRLHFPSSFLMGRYPYSSFFQSVGDIGYHNDFFMPNNLSSERFETTVDTEERWKQGPIGGEAPPEFRDGSNADIVFTTPTGMEMIETGHYSTMLLAGSPDDSNQTAGYMTLHRRMGYNYQIDTASFPEKINQNAPFEVSLTIDNVGVAPLYYDWRVEYALLGVNDLPVRRTEAQNYDLRELLPGTETELNGMISTVDVDKGNYRVAVRVIQPNSQIIKSEPWKLLARNTYILFSNDIPVINGTWNANNALVGGWSILGELEVQ